MPDLILECFALKPCIAKGTTFIENGDQLLPVAANTNRPKSGPTAAATPDDDEHPDVGHRESVGI